MKKLLFTIEDKAIAELFGRQNFSTKESAIFELVKNSYDAGSKECIVEIKQTENEEFIKIIDFGCGMNEEDIKKNWMHVGKSNKGYIDEKISKRVLAGAKGVGRFALARLGDEIEMTSQKLDSYPIIWKTNWESSSILNLPNKIKSGTEIKIKTLREKWKEKDKDKLIEFLSRAYYGNEMKISVIYNETKEEVQELFSKLKMGINYTSKILLDYVSEDNTLNIEVVSDEFKKEVQEISNDFNILNFNMTKDMSEELSSNILKEEFTKETLTDVGSFKMELYFAMDRVPVDATEKFMYKHGTLIDPIKSGIILYRNAFSISSLEGKKDWIGLGARARKSPAAATHPTGAWRVRANQLSGFVQIDKKRNNFLIDLANRQGLEENEYYESFLKIIDSGIKEFERYRQNIIRVIDKKNKSLTELEPKKTKIMDRFIKNPKIIERLPKKDIKKLATEMETIKKTVTQQTKESKEKEARYKYDVRILNSLATQGLKAGATAHEFHADRNKLAKGTTLIIDALKKYEYWEELKSPDKTKFAYANVPQLLLSLDKINKKLGIFLDTILKKMKKDAFTSPIKSLEKELKFIINNWKKDYEWLEIKLNGKNIELDKYSFTADVLDVIFDNLILNSIQNNQLKDKLIIEIDYLIKNNVINFSYKDNGIGLNKKYLKNPFKILEVHETSRKDGHGLGMWIINNTLQMYGGQIDKILNDDGFKLEFQFIGG
ncbi:ATP-binding protein [Haliovirga abyssi]|uniref:Histidine kinase/HSP90-like ATPase domain-containing protein n=1 Tax=Haliovirga abyssi TaxID=2996794 RepID=A0AAU9DMH2_9FUSO|nr:ATP-binding protein [Haliovirga abyssi]BDU49483.1 hypothetical protein HLVA_00520 [Haliovirga abyssi]